MCIRDSGKTIIEYQINSGINTLDISFLKPATYILDIGEKSYKVIKK